MKNGLERLKQHNSGKEFWNAAIVIVSKTDELTKCQIRYLEWYCCEEVKRIGRGRLLNRSFSKKPFVSESVMADLMEMYETIVLLLSTLDYPILEPLVTDSKREVLYCRSSKAEASGEKISDGFVVFKGSTVSVNSTDSLSDSVKHERTLLKENGVIQEDGQGLVFSSDYLFPSPSRAAAVVLGRSSNGWTAWKDAEGRTLDQILRQVIKE